MEGNLCVCVLPVINFHEFMHCPTEFEICLLVQYYFKNQING